MTDEELREQKEVAFYASGVEAWFGTRMEHDRSLLVLSSGGIGLLVTLMSTVGIGSVESLILYVVALVSFLVCAAIVLWIFKRNAQYLEQIIRGKTDTDPLLGMLDTIAISSFLLGVLLSSIIGVAAAVHAYQAKETVMPREEKGKEQTRQVIIESFDGADKIRPSEGDLKKSFSGAAKLRPEPAPAQPTQQPATTSNQSDANKK